MKIFEKYQRLYYVALFVIFMLFGYFVCSCLYSTLWSDNRFFCGDQLIFEMIGKDWANGVVPYTHYIDHKGPVVFLYFCLSYLISDTYSGLIILSSIWLCISMILLYTIVFRMNICKTTVLNRIFSIFIRMLFVLFFQIVSFFDGITIGFIVLPILLGCVLIWQYWLKDSNFYSSKYLHLLYGFLCSLLVLGRASDAVYAVLIYAFTFFYKLFHKDDVKRLLINLSFVIIGGVVLFVFFVVYFASYGVLDVFLNCTFWANLKYSVPVEYVPSSAMLQGFVICGAYVLVIVSVFSGKLKEYVQFKSMVPYILAVACHMALYFSGAMFLQYMLSYSIDVLFVLVFYFHNKDCYGLEKLHKKSCIIAGMVFVCTFLFSVIGTYVCKDAYHDYWTYLDRVRTVLHDTHYSEKRVMSTDSAEFLGIMFDEGYMPPCERSLYQSWHVMCNVCSWDDIDDSIEKADLDLIYLAEPFYSKYIYDAYEETGEYVLWNTTEGVAPVAPILTTFKIYEKK